MDNSSLFLCILFLLFSSFCFAQESEPTEDPALAHFELDSLVAQLEPTGRPWLPFMKGNNVLTGLYILKAGAEDGQRPHDTDEVYYVATGKGKFVAGGEEVSIQAGSILFVKAEVEHKFFDITEDLVLVVFFDQ
ncbi:MAG: cupin domain-containing protein [Bacteroidota bacterium]